MNEPRPTNLSSSEKRIWVFPGDRPPMEVVMARMRQIRAARERALREAEEAAQASRAGPKAAEKTPPADVSDHGRLTGDRPAG